MTERTEQEKLRFKADCLDAWKRDELWYHYRDKDWMVWGDAMAGGGWPMNPSFNNLDKYSIGDPRKQSMKSSESDMSPKQISVTSPYPQMTPDRLKQRFDELGGKTKLTAAIVSYEKWAWLACVDERPRKINEACGLCKMHLDELCVCGLANQRCTGMCCDEYFDARRAWMKSDLPAFRTAAAALRDRILDIVRGYDETVAIWLEKGRLIFGSIHKGYLIREQDIDECGVLAIKDPTRPDNKYPEKSCENCGFPSKCNNTSTVCGFWQPMPSPKQPEYRQWTKEEAIGKIVRSNYGPYSKTMVVITKATDKLVFFSDEHGIGLDMLLEFWYQIDGTACGVKL